MHADALQRIKQKMRIDLAVQREQFCILSFHQHLLFFNLILIHNLNEFICSRNHAVVIAHQASNLIFSTHIRNRHQMFPADCLKHFAEFADSLRK